MAPDFLSCRSLQSLFDYFSPLFRLSHRKLKVQSNSCLSASVHQQISASLPTQDLLHHQANLLGLFRVSLAISSIRSHNVLSWCRKGRAEQGCLAREMQLSSFSRSVSAARAAWLADGGLVSGVVLSNRAGALQPGRCLSPPWYCSSLLRVPATDSSTQVPPWRQGLLLPCRVGLRGGSCCCWLIRT